MDRGTIHSVAEFEHIHEMQNTLYSRLLESKRKETAAIHSLRAAVLTHVVNENYEQAASDLKSYVNSKSQYPAFQNRAARLMNHCSELIQAISTKRNFPGLTSLSLNKQQEIHEKVLQHFEELKLHLRGIEKLEREQKLEDMRSTVWVLRALCQGVAVIFVMALFLDIRDGHFSSVFSVANGYLDSLTSWVISFIHI